MNTNALRKLWKTVFGDSDTFLDSFFSIAYSPQRCKYYEQDGEAICALYWFDCAYEGGRLAYIYAVATHPDHRGKGLASQLLKQTHAHLKSLGYAGCVLKPASGLFPFYERLGYVTSGFVCRFHAQSSTEPVPLEVVSAGEYGRLRRSYLPKSGIIQEDITLEFLQTFATFYASESAIFCLFREEPIFFEYLGNPDSAPGILATLQIKTAEIPTIGQEIPYVMWHPLNCTKKPGYLGITLE